MHAYPIVDALNIEKMVRFVKEADAAGDMHWHRCAMHRTPALHRLAVHYAYLSCDHWSSLDWNPRLVYGDEPF
jgi:hypothetical protein